MLPAHIARSSLNYWLELGSSENQERFRELRPAMGTGSIYKQKKEVIQKPLDWLQLPYLGMLVEAFALYGHDLMSWQP